MSSSFQSLRSQRPLIEHLESRQFLSVSLPASVLPTSNVSASITITNLPILTGTAIHAEAGQGFRAVIGSVRNLPSLPKGYTLQASINWGDSTASSTGQLVAEKNGSLDVIGSHTYAAAGSDTITCLVTAVPPAGTTTPVLRIGSFTSKADVITPNGGVTLNESAGAAFSAILGNFHSNLSATKLTAMITWGDGTQSVGKIIALPTLSPIPTFTVVGDHTYANTGSYPVHVTVIAPSATNLIAVTLVAQFDSVIDVLPISSIVA